MTRFQEFAKRLARLAVYKLGGVNAAAEFTGIDEGELSRFQNEHTDRHPPFFRIIELNEACGDAILKSWARSRGFELIGREQKRELTEGIAKLAGKIATESAAFLSTALEAGSDGICSHHEVREIETAKADAIEVIETAAAAVVSMPRQRGA
jgi:hypothetical protein